jgi:hypothetical protein
VNTGDIDFVQVNTYPYNPLGADKLTLVRIRPRVLGATAPVTGVGGRIALGDAISDPSRWISGIDSLNTVTVDPAAPIGAGDVPLDRTVNFLLPAEWTREGVRNFSIWLNDEYGPHVAECLGCLADNKITVARAFQRFKPLNMMMFQVIDAAGHVPSREEMSRSLRGVRQLYPIDRVNVWNRGIFDADFDWAAPVGSAGGCNGAWNELILRFRLISFWEIDPADNMFWHGFVDDQVASPNGGCGYTDSRESASQVSATGQGGGLSAAHEMGHNQGWSHVACTVASGTTDPAYPISSGLLDRYGLDLSGGTATMLDKAGTYENMSYCGPRWMSEYQYQRSLGGYFGPASLARARGYAVQAAPNASNLDTEPVPDPNGNYIFVSGVITNGVTAALAPAYRITLPSGSSDTTGTGMFSLEIQDMGGAALFVRKFSTSGHNFNGMQTSGAFFEVLPFAPGAQRIVLKHGTTPLVTRALSPNRPSVQVTAPNGGESWPASGTRAISWNAGDADGDPLKFVVQYSPNNGATWSALAVNVSGNTLAVDVSTMRAATQGRIRVIASDGMNSSSDESNAPFSVVPKSPQAMILSPLDGATVAPGSEVMLEGIGSDADDGPLGDAALRWTSDVQGALGTGAYLSTNSLLPGWHAITLTVTDSTNAQASETVHIYVGSRLVLPFVRR